MAKSIVLSVSCSTGCYRHIQIGDSATLYDLHAIILDAYGFVDDHLHAFFMSNRAWDEINAYLCPDDDLDEGLGYTADVQLSKLKLAKDKKFLYIFDYGADWRFQIKVLRILEEATPTPLVLKSIGKIIQYPDYEGSEDDM